MSKRKRGWHTWRHGHSTRGSMTTTYRSWSAMIQRCQNKKHRAFSRYGKRGIKVCKRWRDSFAAFLTDVGSRPSDKHTLDRKNNSKGYEPGNVRWATRKEQQRNRGKNNRMVTIDGDTRCVAEWAELYGIDRHVVGRRLDLGWDPIEALTKKIRRKR